MQPLNIELQDIQDIQDIADAAATGHDAQHRSMAISHIQAGGVVNATRSGAPVGQAMTVEELEFILG